MLPRFLEIYQVKTYFTQGRFSNRPLQIIMFLEKSRYIASIRTILFSVYVTLTPRQPLVEFEFQFVVQTTGLSNSK